MDEIACYSFNNIELRPRCEIISDKLAATFEAGGIKPSSQTCVFALF